MGKQHLEGHFRDVIKAKKGYWYIKLQTFPGACTPNPADFMVLNDDTNILVECKECCNKRFDFARLTQKDDLLRFYHALKRNKAFVLIGFWKGRRKKSLYFLIPILDMVDLIVNIDKKSINQEDLDRIYRPQTLENISDFKVLYK